MSRQAALANNPLAPDSLARSIDLTSNLRSLFDRGGSGNIRKQSTLRLEWLRPNPGQPRRQFSPEEMQALQASIQTHGILEPIVVRLVGQTYEIICGERRFRAAQALGLPEVPAVVRDATDDEAFILSIQENVQRNDLTPLEEARAYKTILDKGQIQSQRELARLLGISQSRISHKLALLDLPEDIQNRMNSTLAPAEATTQLITRESSRDSDHKVISGESPCDQEHQATSGLSLPDEAPPELLEASQAETTAPATTSTPRSRSRRLTERHIRAVRRLANPTSQKLLLDQIATKRLSVAQTEQLVDQVLASAARPDGEQEPQPVLAPRTWTVGAAHLAEGPDGLRIHLETTDRAAQVAQLREVLASLLAE
jgi:ParB/RepB/Spo0J family partition protein